MKTRKMTKNLFPFLIAILCIGLLAGCSATENLQVNTMEPAPVDLENSIKRIGILNTSLAIDKEEYDTRLEQLISYEDYRLVKEGKKAAINALFEELKNDGRFDTVLLVENTPNSLLGLDANPSIDKWDNISQLCNIQNVDAIFCLTYFDADTSFETRKAKVDEHNMLRVKNEVKGHEITLETLVENGWRIYNPRTKEVIDEFIYTDQIIATAKGITPLSALESMESRQEDIIAQSVETGSTYGSRLKPFEKKIARPYYSSGTENFKSAHEAIEAEKWDEAMVYLEKEVSNPKNKIKAKACYNIAVLKESQGDLSEALIWAKKAGEAHDLDLLDNYLLQLDERMANAELVAGQMAYIAPEDP